MAKFWKHLVYHEDNTEKHKITKEEIEFLKDLQHEMNTQDHVGQADPRYWVIRDSEKIFAENLNNADGICVYDRQRGEKIYESDYSIGIRQMRDEILEKLESKGYGFTEDEIQDFEVISDRWDLKGVMEGLEGVTLEVQDYMEIPIESGFFLTQRAAEEHLRANHYHYNVDAHTYAHTAWRSKEATLWDILQKVDFDAMN